MARLVFRFLALTATLVPAIASAQVDYAKAERMLTWNTAPLVINEVISVTWLADSTRFWYRVSRPNGAEFMLVDPVANTQRPLFDHLRLASALTRMDAGKKSYEAVKLPFQTFNLLNGDRTLRFKSGDRWIDCDLTRYECAPTAYKPRSLAEVVSPDSQWVAYVKNYNIWVKRAAGGDSTQLTTDGVRFNAYGATEPVPSRVRSGVVVVPGISWSPDSKRLLVLRTDERGVGMVPLYSSTTIRPTSYLTPYALPGDSVFEKGTRYLIDIASKTSIAITGQAVSAIGFGGGGARGVGEWSADGRTFLYGDMTRADKVASMYRVDAQTGARKRLAFDSSATYVDQVEFHVFPGARGTMAMSERDGWKHLYLFDTTGRVERQLTSGPWLVASIVRVVDSTGTVYFTGEGRENGRDPYYTKGYRVKTDGTPVELLTSEDADHDVRVAPGGRFIVDTYSRVDLPPVTVLRASDGRILRTLEKADVSALMATGYRPPEPFKVKARDGVTDLYGAIWKPNAFDSTKIYPVIDNIYPGPQATTGPKSFVPTNNFNTALSSWYSQYSQAKALAELGFIVVNLDAMGTTHRSKAFRETWFANMGDNGLPDHIAGLKQLASTRPYMDLNRVGIYGISGGGFASADAILRYPEFFKAAVSSSGNHDNRSYNMHWGEKYTGVLARDTVRKSDNFDSQANFNLAANLRGKLFLIHGDMDDNVSPANTLRLADALIKAGKTFDMLIVPDATHQLYLLPYVHRVHWDFFVRNLRHEEPPADYIVGGPPPPS